MAATSSQTHGLGHQGKITKSRARGTVKPILKKLHSSHSEKNSLDLDRGWDDQQSPYLGYVAPDYTSGVTYGPGKHHYTADDAPGQFGTSYPAGAVAGTGGQSARDVSFTLSATDLSKSCSGGAAGAGLAATTTVSHSTTTSTVNSASATSTSTSNQFSHVRSTSGVSNISTATSASGGRNGSFVHPFQQMPRTSTPPLLPYANSVNSVENNTQRDYSPTITENDDNLEPFAVPNPNSRPLQHTLPHSHANFGYRRPSLAASQRTSSLSDVTPPVGVSTARTNSGTVPRGVTYGASATVNQYRLSDGLLGTTPSVTVIDDSPIASTSVGKSSPQIPASHFPGSASASPMSPLRHSLDMNHFRIRSRSDVDTATRQEHVRLARRRFEEKEKAKEEKYEREQVRKRERADTKEAQRHERAQSRKGSLTTIGRTSTSEARPVISRKSTSHNRPVTVAEKAAADNDFTSHGYDDMTSGQSPGRADEVQFESNKRSRATAKRKTTGAWTAFVLWFRTRLLKLGRR